MKTGACCPVVCNSFLFFYLYLVSSWFLLLSYCNNRDAADSRFFINLKLPALVLLAVHYGYKMDIVRCILSSQTFSLFFNKRKRKSNTLCSSQTRSCKFSGHVKVEHAPHKSQKRTKRKKTDSLDHERV